MPEMLHGNMILETDSRIYSALKYKGINERPKTETEKVSATDAESDKISTVAAQPTGRKRHKTALKE
jgi:hypothetical protein